MTPLFLQFHHVPLYLEWAPIGVFGAAPQKKDSQPEQPAQKAEAEQETGESRIGSSCCGQRWEEGWVRETVIRPLAGCASFCLQIDVIDVSSVV